MKDALFINLMPHLVSRQEKTIERKEINAILIRLSKTPYRLSTVNAGEKSVHEMGLLYTALKVDVWLVFDLFRFVTHSLALLL